jgi:hypothetical protein
MNSESVSQLDECQIADVLKSLYNSESTNHLASLSSSLASLAYKSTPISYFGDSTILDSEEAQATVRGFFPADKNIRFELLYRGSRDGTSSVAFHSKVDN